VPEALQNCVQTKGKEMSNNPVKVFVATPMYGGQCFGFFCQSMMMLQSAVQQRGWHMASSFMFNESLIERARNSLAHAFMKTDCTHLLFIDADIRFDAGQVLAMFDADKDVICGIYPKKEVNWQAVSDAVKNGVPNDQLKHHTGSWVINLAGYQGSVTVPQNEPLEIWAGGTGMMLIKRSVFEKLSTIVPSYRNDVVDLSGTNQPREEIKQYFACSIEPGTERLLSEDYHFCRVWRESGGKIYAAPWMTLGHIGSYLFEGQLIAETVEGPTA
jgi:hypothetical protein